MAGLLTHMIITVGLVIIRLLRLIPVMGSPLAGLVEQFIENLVDLDFKFRGRDFSLFSIPNLVQGLCADRGREAFLGRPAPDVRLCFVDKSPCHLFIFQRPGRPLVINFVSRLEEPMWTMLRDMNDVARRMSWMADFLTIVIGCCVVRSKTDFINVMDTDHVSCMRHYGCVLDRRTMASVLVDAGIAGDLVFDPASNDAMRKYGAMPERLFVVYNDTITYVGDRGGHGRIGYDVHDLQRHLQLLSKEVRQKLLAKSQSMRYMTGGRRQVGGSDHFNRNDPRHPRNLQHGVGVPLKDDPSVTLSIHASMTHLLGGYSNMDVVPERGILKCRPDGANNEEDIDLTSTRSLWDSL